MSEQLAADAALRRLLDESVGPRLEGLRSKTFDYYGFSVVGRYYTLIELCESLLVLFNSGCSHQGFILLRTALENYADLVILILDPNYLDSLDIEALRSRIKWLVSVKEGNFFLKGVARTLDVESELSSAGKALEGLQKKAKAPLSISEKLQRVKLADFERASLWMLHDFTHGGSRSVHERHARRTEKGFRISLLEDDKNLENQICLRIAHDILLAASEIVHIQFETGWEKRFGDLIEENSLVEGAD